MKIVKYILAFSLLPIAVVAIYFSQFYRPQPKVAAQANCPKPHYVDEQELFSKIVTYKQENGLKAPTQEQSLCKIASMRVGAITGDGFNHDGFYGEWKFQFSSLDGLTENISRNYLDSQGVLEGWKNSPPHNKHLLTNSTYACVECANIDSVNYCVYISAI